MITELNHIKKHLSFEILDYKVINYKVYLTVIKNGEELVFTFPNEAGLKQIIGHIKKQIKFGNLNKENGKQILKTMTENKSEILLMDNNFNMIQCFTPKEHQKSGKRAEMDFLRDKEKWGVGKRLNNKIVKLIDNKISDYKEECTEEYNQKVYLHEEDSFIFIPKGVTMLVETEMMYLLRINKNTNEFFFCLNYNSGWIYN